ncbi:MAG: DNA-directed RNA polymerase subunit K, partial [Cenarchaeum sp. SB0669_bin_11]|nr:DNA-directed RNA polymerase subunit K [Cenarchaeum sp. SB0669_bin_11]
METRDVIEYNEEHTATEIVSEGDERRVLIGPPTLTRFEKARIMGARALQLSMGAP